MTVCTSNTISCDCSSSASFTVAISLPAMVFTLRILDRMKGLRHSPARRLGIPLANASTVGHGPACTRSELLSLEDDTASTSILSSLILSQQPRSLMIMSEQDGHGRFHGRRWRGLLGESFSCEYHDGLVDSMDTRSLGFLLLPALP
jgi:hypothetical protein